MPLQLEKNIIEDYLIENLRKEGWVFVPASDLGRESLAEPLLIDKLRKAIFEINKGLEITDSEVNEVLNEIKLLGSGQEGCKKILYYLKYGVPVKFEKEGVVKTVYLFDFENSQNNEFVVSRQVKFKGQEIIRCDIILFVNGISLVDIECKNPTGPGQGWQIAYKQIKDYEQLVPELYKYIQIGIAAEAQAKYFPIVSWQKEANIYEWKEEGKDSVDSILEFLKPVKLLDILRNFVFFREERNEASKIIARYMQYQSTNKIVQRVIANLEGKDKKNKGLIWHWQGSGKTLTMIFAGHKLYFDRRLENPTLFFIVDRIELETQLSNELNSLQLNFSPDIISSVADLKEIIQADNLRGKRGVFVMLIHKFRPEELGEVNRWLDSYKDMETIEQRKNIVAFLDEVHRTQYGILAAQMKKILKNAFFFGFTGTPISEDERNTYETFGYPLNEESYLDKYFVDDALRDGFTVKIVYQPRLDKLHLKRELLDVFLEIAFEDLDEAEKEKLEPKVSKKLNQIKIFLENPQRIQGIAEDLSAHFKENLDGKFKAMVVTGSRKACVLYKNALDKFLPSNYSEIVMTYTLDDEEIIKNYHQKLKELYPAQEDNKINTAVKDNFREEGLPKILIVTDMLLTGFDAPILQTLYLDKPLKKHRLLQAIARTNRPYKGVKEAGLIIDYVGVLKEIKLAFKAYYKEPEIRNILTSFDSLVSEFVSLLNDLREIFRGIPQTYERKTLFKAFQVLQRSEEAEKNFLEKYWSLRKVFEMLGVHEVKIDYLEEFKWYSAIYMYFLKIKNQKEDEREKIEKYFKRTLSFVHRSTEIDKLNTDLPLFKFDENYLQKLRKSNLTPAEKAANLVFTLERLVLVEQNKNPVYQSLADKVVKLVELWQQKAEDYERVYQEGLNILQTIEKSRREQEEIGLTSFDYSLYLILERWVGDKDTRLDYVWKLKELIAPLMIPNWTEQPAIRKKIEQELRIFLRKILMAAKDFNIDGLNNATLTIFEYLQNYEKWS